MYLAGAVILFALFVANVALGALAGTPFVGDVGEALILFAASIVFVIAILKREAADKAAR